MMQEVEVLKTIQELICSFFSEEQFTLSIFDFPLANSPVFCKIERCMPYYKEYIYNMYLMILSMNGGFR